MKYLFGCIKKNSILQESFSNILCNTIVFNSRILVAIINTILINLYLYNINEDFWNRCPENIFFNRMCEDNFYVQQKEPKIYVRILTRFIMTTLTCKDNDYNI